MLFTAMCMCSADKSPYKIQLVSFATNVDLHRMLFYNFAFKALPALDQSNQD